MLTEQPCRSHMRRMLGIDLHIRHFVDNCGENHVSRFCRILI